MLLYFIMSHKPVQCRIQMFFWAYCFLEGLESLVIYTQKPAVDLAQGPKIFYVQCIWGRIFEKNFVFKYLQTISFSFYVKCKAMENCYRNVFGYPYHLSSTKIHLDVALLCNQQSWILPPKNIYQRVNQQFFFYFSNTDEYFFQLSKQICNHR